MATQTVKPLKAKRPSSPHGTNGRARPGAETRLASTIEILPPRFELLQVEVVGDAPLICHRFDEKAKQMMLDKQQKKAKAPKESKDPKALVAASLYEDPKKRGRYGMPASAFKCAAIDACRQLDGVTMAEMKGAFHIVADFMDAAGLPCVEVKGKMVGREDAVRLANGVADLRYRGSFPEWRVHLTLRFNAAKISPEQLVNLLNTAGFACGIGEWRPSAPRAKSGVFGTFHLERVGHVPSKVVGRTVTEARA